MTSPLTKNLIRKLKSGAEETGYPRDWSRISDTFRKKHGYICKDCGVCCKEHPNVLDVHHINAVKSDCADDNLRCLCKECHSEQPLHGGYKRIISSEDKEILSQLRKAQGLRRER